MGLDAKFTVELEIIDANPFELLPPAVLNNLLREAGRSKGPIPIRGTINGKSCQQTLVEFRGAWRLDVNMKMLADSPRRIGEVIDMTVSVDRADRRIEPHPKLVAILDATPAAREVFDDMSPSSQKEIVRYIDALKSEERVDRNVLRARDFLLGEGSFVGRDSP